MKHIRLLIWLKWTLLWRGYARSKMSLVGVIAALLLFVPTSLILAVSTAAGYRFLDPPNDVHLLRGVLLGIYLLWILGPLFGYSLNESYDITRLLVYPLSPRRLFIGVICGALLDFPVLLTLPVLCAIGFGFLTRLSSTPLVILPVLIFLFHTVAMTQTLLLVGAGFLRSRRFRDSMIIVGPLLGMLYFLALHLLPRQHVPLSFRAVVESPGWELINYLPPGLAARAIANAATGHDAPSLGYLFLLTICAVITVYLAGWVISRLATGVVISGPAAAQRPHRRSVQSAAGLSARLRLPPVMSAIIEKELLYFARDPFFKAYFTSTLLMLAFWAIALLRPFAGKTPSFGVSSIWLWMIASMNMITTAQLTWNVFGTEGSAAATLFTFPSSRRQILLAKNVLHLPLLIAINALLVTLLSLFGKVTHELLPLLLWVVLMVVILVAVGNLFSIFFPMPIVMRGWRFESRSAALGLGRSLVFLLLMFLVLPLLLALPLLALLVPAYWAPPLWYLVTVPLALAYVTGAYLLSLHAAERLLLQREIELAEKLQITE